MFGQYSEQSATRRDLLKWTLDIIDSKIAQEEELAQYYHSIGDKPQAVYFQNRLTWDYAGRRYIAEELDKCD